MVFCFCCRKSTDSSGSSGLNMAMTGSLTMASSSCSNSSSTGSNSGGGSGGGGGINKYCMSSEQCDMTPSPSDSGISDLEAALKDRDSELSYLRQTMEHNEKVIFKVQKVYFSLFQLSTFSCESLKLIEETYHFLFSFLLLIL